MLRRSAFVLLFVFFFALSIDIPSLHIPIHRANRIFPTTFCIQPTAPSQAQNPIPTLVVTALTTKREKPQFQPKMIF